MNSDYSVLAKYYDKFTQNDCDYESWSQYLYAIANGCGAKQIVELACGTGKMTKLLTEKGLKVLGIDSSAEMLNQARGKCRTQFVLQDMTELELPRPYQMAICVNDGVNYVSGKALGGFFKRVADNLVEDAPFVFDVSTPFKFAKVISDNTFYYDDEGETLLWTNSTTSSYCEMSLTLFVKNNGKYDRFDEFHKQYIHSRETIANALINAGFALIEHTADYGGVLKEDSLRWTFYAVKK